MASSADVMMFIHINIWLYCDSFYFYSYPNWKVFICMTFNFNIVYFMIIRTYPESRNFFKDKNCKSDSFKLYHVHFLSFRVSKGTFTLQFSDNFIIIGKSGFV